MKAGGLIELSPNGDPFGRGFTGSHTVDEDESSWVYWGDIGAQSRDWWRTYCYRNDITLREWRNDR